MKYLARNLQAMDDKCFAKIWTEVNREHTKRSQRKRSPESRRSSGLNSWAKQTEGLAPEEIAEMMRKRSAKRGVDK